jgi:hypothetical protein
VRSIALVPIVAISVLISGCGTLPSPEAASDPCPSCAAPPAPEIRSDPWIRASGPRPVGEAESLLIYYEYVRKIPAAERAKDNESARQRYMKSRSDFNRVRYAISLSVPGTPFNDDARALDALEPLLKNNDAVLHNLAYLVSAQIQEQRRGQSLQQKLDALKSLEKSLIERDPGGAAKR